jgi:hypothetical protein
MCCRLREGRPAGLREEPGQERQDHLHVVSGRTPLPPALVNETV